jgi:hypothetical protein
MGKQEQNNSLLYKLFKPEKLSTIVFYLSILFFIIGFNFTDTPTPFGWYQQFMPNLNGRSVTDVFFLDSLTGWAVTNALNQNTDTTYMLKTTNSGDNWIIQYRKIQIGGGFPGYFRIFFINQNTGYTCGVEGVDRSTDGGVTWISLNAPLNSYLDMSALNADTIWIVSPVNPTGGVFRTTNGGASWTQQLAIGTFNPEKIYMFNAGIGFISKNLGSSGYVRKTTDGGASWSLIVSNDYYLHIYFADSLTGWKNSAFGMKKTTDGGLSWVLETMPSGGIIQNSFVGNFTGLNRDTLWGMGGNVMYPNGQTRGILYRTINGGSNWLFQIPDTSINIGYAHITFTDKMHGWVYGGTAITQTGIHTTTGGDTTFLVGVKQLSNIVPQNYKLYQNYPNPFNPATNIKYQIKSNGKSQTAKVKLLVYNILGKEIVTLVNQRQNSGTYQVDFSGNNFSSGVYFYQLIVDGNIIDTKKMIYLR